MRSNRLQAACLLTLLAGCDVFAPRTPEPPLPGGSVFVQPDTPEIVIANVQRALTALDASAYRRSFDDAFRFTPTPEAAARTPIFSGWDAASEEGYLRALVSAATPGAAFTLRLSDQAPPEVSERLYVLDAAYTLTTPHTRPEAPTTVQGRLRWTLTRGNDGLWRITDWTDRSLSAGVPSWSDLKAAFGR
jgi:hypothetical protein